MSSPEEEKPEFTLDVLRTHPILRKGDKELRLSARQDIGFALVLYLIITRESETPRATLLEMLGDRPGAPPKSTHISNILHEIRKAHGENIIKGRQELQWTPSVVVDAERLMRLTEETMDDDLLSFYQSDFQAEWKKLRYAHGFLAWAAKKRDTWRDHAFMLLDARARTLASAGAWDRVAAVGRRIAEIRPDLDEGYGWEIQALAALNQFTVALERYLEAIQVIPAKGRTVGSSLTELGERVRQQQEEEMARRAVEPAAQTTEEDVLHIAVEAPAPAFGAPNHQDIPALPPAPPAQEAEVRNPRRVLPLLLGGLLLLVCAGVLAFVVARNDRGSEPVVATSVCRDGQGSGELVREIYKKGRGVDAGSRFRKGWMLRNTGMCSWEADFRVVRIRERNGGGAQFLVDTDTVPLENRVLHDSVITISIRMRAPNVHDHVRERWSLLDATGANVMIEGSPYLPVDLIVRKRPVPLCSPEEVEAGLVADSHEDRQAVLAGEAFVGSWTLINPRLCGWPKDVQLRRRSGAGPLSGDLRAVVTGDTVLPGDPFTFQVPMRGPQVPNTYSEEWELATGDGTTRQIEAHTTLPIRVMVSRPGEAAQLRPRRCGPGEAQASFIGETVRDGTVVFADSGFTKIWTLQNAGTCRWESPMALRFLRTDGMRISLVDAVGVETMVMPNKTYSFVVPSRAPIQPGTHTEAWQLHGPGSEIVPIPNTNAVWVTIQVPGGRAP